MKIWKNTATLDDLVSELKNTVEEFDAELAVIGSKSINLSRMPNLKAIFKCGVGTDNIPFEEARKSNIEVILPSKKTKDFIFEETANFTIHLILKMLYRDLGELNDWEKNQRKFLGARKVLILGLGNIGKKVSYKLKSFCTVITYDPVLNSKDEIEELFRQADVVSLHMPLSKDTQSFINAEKLSWMKDNAILVNTSRGSIVDENALYDEIKNERLFAAFDVFWEEPYNGLLKSYHPKRFFMTPHIASNCINFLEGLANDLKPYLKNIN
jgi:phosphoglycerate dehydrogenase-like enzyme